MPRTRTVTDDTILAAVARVIANRGLPDLTLGAVADEVGLSPATLLQRFGSKRGMLLSLAERAATTVRSPFRRVSSDHSPLAALRDALAVMPDVTTREQLANHLTFLYMDLTDPEFHAHAVRHREIMDEEITGLLIHAVEVGELAAEVDVGGLARAVRITYDGSMMHWALAGEGSLERAIGADLDWLFTAYRKEKK